MQNVRESLFSAASEGNSFCYLLTETQTLNTTGFKVMHNLASTGLLPAYQSHLNGQLRLVYDVADCISLSGAASSLTPPQFVRIVKSLLQLIGKIRTNGFIRMDNLLLDADHVMLDQSWNVHLIYLPIDDHAHTTAQLASPEIVLRRLLTGFIDANPNVRSERVARLNAALKNDKESFPEALEILNMEPTIVPAAPQAEASTMLQLVGAGIGCVLSIHQQGAVIGRDTSRATALLSDSSVSGVHCRVYWDGQWYVEDLGSRNGTRINGKALRVRQPRPLASGDVLQISTLPFSVKELPDHAKM